MDFHSLSRRQLQSLCKKNKIPANLTNVAMADALKSLEKVEGLDELVNAQQSPEKITKAEPETACRTSTRRKPVNVEPESSRPLTCTRRATRRAADEEAEQENKNVNLPETPAVPTNRRRAPAASTRRKIDAQLIESKEEEKLFSQEKSDVPETPAVQSCRSKAPAVSTRRKVDKSVQRTYGTRNSVRLLEKSMEEMTLKEKTKFEAVKIEGLCEETEEVDQGRDLPDESLENEIEKHEVQEDKNANNDLEVVSVENESEKPGDEADNKANDQEDNKTDHEVDDPEVVSYRNLDQLLENESEMTHELNADDKSNDNEVNFGDLSQDTDQMLGSEGEMNHELNADNKSNDHEVNFGDLSQNTDQMLGSEGETELEIPEDSNGNDAENESEMSHVINADNKSNDHEVNSGDLCQNTDQLIGGEGETKLEDGKGNDIEMTHSVAKMQTGYKTCTNSDNISGLDSEDDNDSSDELSVQVDTSDKALDSNHKTVGEKGSGAMETENSEIMSAALGPEIEKELISNPDFLILGDSAVIITEHTSIVKVPEEGSIKDVDSLAAKKTEVAVESSEMDVIEDEQHDSHDLPSKAVIEKDDRGNCIKELSDGNISDNENAGIDQIMKVQGINAHESAIDKYNTDEIGEIDAQYTCIAYDCHKSAEPDNTPTSVQQKCHFYPLKSEIEVVAKISSVEDPVVPAEYFASAAAVCVQKLDKTPTSSRRINTCQQPVVSEDKLTCGLVVSEDKVTCGMVSSPFAANTIQGQFPRPTGATPRKSSTKNQTTVQEIINKENVDTSGKKVEPKKYKVKKIVSEDLYKKSIRQLTKELKEQLQLKNNEAKNATKVEGREALQILSENCGPAAAEPEHKN